MKKTLERLVDFDRINDLKTRLSVGAVGVTSGNFKYFDNFEFRKLGKKIGPEHIMASGALPPGFPSVEIEGEHYWDGGIASNTPLDHVLERGIQPRSPDLPGRSVQRARRPADVAARGRRARKGHPLFQPHPHEYRQEQADPQRAQGGARSARKIARSICKNDPSVEFLRKAAKENTVTVVHLIYKSKNYETSSKDYDFSHVAMVEHWNAGVRDVHQSMRHKDVLERPQSGETMMAYDMTGDVPKSPEAKQE